MEMASFDVDQFSKWKEIPASLIRRGQELLAQPYDRIEFTGSAEADNLLNDIESYPHAFVLACLMDRQVRAERAWSIPHKVSKEIGGFDFDRLVSLELEAIREIFAAGNLHRFSDTMAVVFHSAIDRIHREHRNDASNIWKGNPKSARVVLQFLQFEGAGIKIASMAANILARDFKIPMSDKLCIDISPDRHVHRVFARLCLIGVNATNDELLYRARELNPEYPGVFDLSA